MKVGDHVVPGYTPQCKESSCIFCQVSCPQHPCARRVRVMCVCVAACIECSRISARLQGMGGWVVLSFCAIILTPTFLLLPYFPPSSPGSSPSYSSRHICHSVTQDQHVPKDPGAPRQGCDARRHIAVLFGGRHCNLPLYGLLHLFRIHCAC